MIRVGSLCTGYDGIGLGLELAGWPVDRAWFAETDPAMSRVLAHHWPATSNLGNIRAVDWTTVPQVDVLTAGYPCQSLSFAGRRAGLNDERWLWDDGVFPAVRDLRPGLVLLENVPGHLSLGFGRVLGDLASIGYVGSWHCVRASDVGAPHRRERVFIAAHPADAPGDGHRHAWPTGFGGVPAATVAGGVGADGLPTPTSGDGTSGPGNSGREGTANLRTVAPLLPTPRATGGTKGGPNQRGSSGDLMLPSAVCGTDCWGRYAPAIARWAGILGRPAPEPTEPGTKGQQRLSPRFVEWLMGLPAGHVTDHCTRTEALRGLGNGVVPQQYAEASAFLLASLDRQQVAA